MANLFENKSNKIPVKKNVPVRQDIQSKKVVKTTTPNPEDVFGNEFDNVQIKRKVVPVQNNPVKPEVKKINPNKVKKTGKMVFVFITIVLLIIFLVLGWFLISKFAAKNISDEDLAKGISFDLKLGKKANFNFDEEKQVLTLKNIASDKTEFTIGGENLLFGLKKEETKKFDLDDNEFYDIKIKLNSFNSKKANIFLQEIHEEVCVENWDCENWSVCNVNGTQYRTCVDVNHCETEKTKPILEKSCVYENPCNPNWVCGSWSSCIDNKKTRTCTDTNNCNTNKDKPTEYLDCAVVNS